MNNHNIVITQCKYAWLFTLLSFLSACATTGPGIQNSEVAAAKKELDRKSLDFIYDKQLHVTSLGHEILKNLPDEKATGSYATLPLMYQNVNTKVQNVYGLSYNRGVMFIGMIPGFAPEGLQMQRGDQIIAFQNEPVNSESDINKRLEKIGSEKEVKLRLRHPTQEWEINLPVYRLKRTASFIVSGESMEIDAHTDAKGVITVSTAMLRFVESDDELAFILAHEIAHLTEGHIAQTVANNAAGLVAGAFLGALANRYAPGTGYSMSQTTAAVVASPYSQEMEREADYVGLSYLSRTHYDLEKAAHIWERFAIEIPASSQMSILATHPSSPERFVRIKKAIEEIKTKNPSISKADDSTREIEIQKEIKKEEN